MVIPEALIFPPESQGCGAQGAKRYKSVFQTAAGSGLKYHSGEPATSLSSFGGGSKTPPENS